MYKYDFEHMQKDNDEEMTKSKAVRKLLVTDDDVMAEAGKIAGRALAGVNSTTDDCLTVKEIAREIGIEANDLNSFLKDIGVQVWKRGQFQLTPAYERRGLAKPRLFIYYSKDGKEKRRTYLVWTQKGAEFIRQLIIKK